MRWLVSGILLLLSDQTVLSTEGVDDSFDDSLDFIKHLLSINRTIENALEVRLDQE